MEKEIIIDNQLDEVARIALFIEELGMSLQLPASITMSLNLAIEEAALFARNSCEADDFSLMPNT